MRNDERALEAIEGGSLFGVGQSAAATGHSVNGQARNMDTDSVEGDASQNGEIGNFIDDCIDNYREVVQVLMSDN